MGGNSLKHTRISFFFLLLPDMQSSAGGGGGMMRQSLSVTGAAQGSTLGSPRSGLKTEVRYLSVWVPLPA